ncbi:MULTISPECIES: hypothetical protein [unclassified Mycobacteroides]|nr:MULTISPECIES: hypothetical protein [unclassified Mycobacteroides]
MGRYAHWAHVTVELHRRGYTSIQPSRIHASLASKPGAVTDLIEDAA